MSRKLWIAVAVLGTVASSFAQEGRPRIDVEHYVINAEINPNTQSLAGTASVRFTTQEDRISSVVFELHNALNVSKVEDESGRELGASRSRNHTGERRIEPDRPEAVAQSAVRRSDAAGRSLRGQHHHRCDQDVDQPGSPE